MKKVRNRIKGNERTSMVKSQLEEGSRDRSFYVQQEDIKSEVFHQREISLQDFNTGKRATSVGIKGLLYKDCPDTAQVKFFKSSIKSKPQDNVASREYTSTKQ